MGLHYGAKALTKKGKGRPRAENPMVHTAIALPQDLLDQLKSAAAASGQGLSTEIRRRLQLVDGLEVIEAARDPETKDLVKMMENLADNLAGDLGKKWHEHAYALTAFKAGVAALLAQYNAGGDASVRPDTRVVGESNDSPETVGRTHARLIWIAAHP
jgi:hypothetical protein